MILVTGGAGFIGSNLHAALAARGREVVVVDRLGSAGKWRNLAHHPPSQIVRPEALDDFLATHPPIEMVFHLGAVSETTASDGDLVWGSNVELPLRLWTWCAARGVRFVYASSAATYGAGEHGFDDDPAPAAAPPSPQPLWLDQARLRPAGRGDPRRRQAAAAAMGGAQILQRLRPERVPQADDGLGGEAHARRARRRPSRQAVPLRPARPRRRRAGAGLHLGRRRRRRAALAARGPGRERAVQCRHRDGRAAISTSPMPCATRRACRAGSSSSTCRRNCAAPTNPSPRRGWTGCARPAMAPRSRRWRRGCRRYVTDYLAAPDPYR